MWDGDCFCYYPGDTLSKWCDRNGFPLPVTDDKEAIAEFGRQFSENGIVIDCSKI